jgi:LysM repeat protein
VKFRVALALVLVGRLSAAESQIEFTGVLATGDAVRVALRDASGTSSWVKVGAAFSGYTLTSYDAATESVVLTHDGVTTRVKLSSPRPTAANAVVAPPEIATAITQNLRQLAAAANQYYLENGRTTAVLADLVGETKYVRRLIPVAGEDYGVLQFDQGSPLLTVQTSQGYTVTLDRRPTEHIIRSGETLSSIARQYGTTVKEIGVLNQLSDPTKIAAGQKLRIK